MENIVIDRPERIEDDIEDFKLDAVDDEKNYTVAKIKLCRDPQNHTPLLFYSQELARNFKDESDPFGKRHLIKVFTPSNHEAAADSVLERKFNDTILAHKPRIQDYSPLSDIHSQKMNLFMDDTTATFLSDIGVNVDGLGEDFQSIESVSASPFMEDISYDASRLKSELRDLRGRFILLKEQMAQDFKNQYVDPKTLTDEEFDTLLSQEKVSQKYIQTYLALKEQIARLESQIGEVSSAIFSETSSKIRLPKLMENKAHETKNWI